MSVTDESDLAGAYAGERIFLIGNGPSLAETPLDALQDEYTMAMNRIDLIYDTVDWRPDFYICMRDRSTVRDALRNSIDVHLGLDRVRCFLDESWENHISFDRKIMFLRGHGILGSDEQTPNNISMRDLQDVDIAWLERFWSYNPEDIVYRYHTMYMAAQLAMWMGFKQIYMLGVDLGLDIPNYMIFDNGIDPNIYGGEGAKYFSQSFQEGKLPSAVVNGLALKTVGFLIRIGLLQRITRFTDAHFVDSYADHVFPSHANEELRKSHAVIKRLCTSNDIDVYNATLGGELEVYPRVNLHRILE